MSENDTLLGVVEPAPVPWDQAQALEAQLMEHRSSAPRREYEVVANAVTTGLEGVQQRLRLLREEKEQLRHEIKRLVAEERQLQRMAHIAETPLTEGPD